MTSGDNGKEYKLTAFGDESIVYDAIGNPTTYRGATLTWDGRQLMSYSKESTNISYQYDADGLRTKQIVYDEEGRVSSNTIYIWDNGQLVGYTSEMYDYSDENGTVSSTFNVKIHYDEASEPYAVTLGDETYYYIRNAVGDVKGLVRADTGEYVMAVSSSAYGMLAFSEPDLTFDTSGVIETNAQIIIRMMKKIILRMCLCLPTANTYKGYSYDIFTGLYYLQSRYYDPEVGRFINADDVDYLGVSGKPISYNLFAYCENNPVNNSDPTGYGPFGAIIGAILGFGLGILLVPKVADMLKLRGFGRKAFIALGVAALTGLGAYVGHYVGKAILAIYKVGGTFALKINKAIANGIRKIVGGKLSIANGNGWVLKVGRVTLRIMTSSNARNNYFRLSHITKGAITIAGQFSSDRGLTHIPITINSIIQIINLIRKFK